MPTSFHFAAVGGGRSTAISFPRCCIEPLVVGALRFDTPPALPANLLHLFRTSTGGQKTIVFFHTDDFSGMTLVLTRSLKAAGSSARGYRRHSCLRSRATEGSTHASSLWPIHRSCGTWFAVPAEAATCTASCQGGTSVSCSGDTCSATDNSGVTCTTTTSCGPGCSTTKNCGSGGGGGTEPLHPE